MTNCKNCGTHFSTKNKTTINNKCELCDKGANLKYPRRISTSDFYKMCRGQDGRGRKRNNNNFKR